jgi:hypothetical protein
MLFITESRRSYERKVAIYACILLTGHRSSYFSIEIIHGGYFVVTEGRRSYVSGHSIWFGLIMLTVYHGHLS